MSGQLLLYYWIDFLQTCMNGCLWCLVVHKGEITHIALFVLELFPFVIFWLQFLFWQLLLYCWMDFFQTCMDCCLWCLVVHKGEITHIATFVLEFFPFVIFYLNLCLDNSSFITGWNFFKLAWMVAYDVQLCMKVR